ncbi:5960_t:CDS:1, partial [Acaulospora colombiana]
MVRVTYLSLILALALLTPDSDAYFFRKKPSCVFTSTQTETSTETLTLHEGKYHESDLKDLILCRDHADNFDFKWDSDKDDERRWCVGKSRFRTTTVTCTPTVHVHGYRFEKRFDNPPCTKSPAVNYDNTSPTYVDHNTVTSTKCKKKHHHHNVDYENNDTTPTDVDYDNTVTSTKCKKKHHHHNVDYDNTVTTSSTPCTTTTTPADVDYDNTVTSTKCKKKHHHHNVEYDNTVTPSSTPCTTTPINVDDDVSSTTSTSCTKKAPTPESDYTSPV